MATERVDGGHKYNGRYDFLTYMAVGYDRVLATTQRSNGIQAGKLGERAGEERESG